MEDTPYEVDLLRAGQRVRSFRVGPRPLELGSAERCDVRLVDAEVGERVALLRAEATGLVLVRLGGGARVSRAHAPKPAGSATLEAGYSLRWRRAEAPLASEGVSVTDAVALPERRARNLSLVVAGRRRRVGHAPVTVGTDLDNDIVLRDRTVSRRHCRFEAGAGGIWVRDVGSRNGTWLGGLRVEVAPVPVGSRLRVGRTTIEVVSEETPGALPAQDGDGGLVACSPAMRRVLAEARRYAPLPWAALIVGESGVGKEGVARLVHLAGRGGPWVVANAGGLPEQLLESELFGHERGAFTGADRLHRGVFERASGGTLFLDEVGELSLRSQAQLLRVLETWQISRVGGEAPIDVDVRLVCATHRDLRAMVRAGSFRRDLYYRLARSVIEIPPLRERREDIVPLAEHFLRELAPVLGPRALGADARAMLLGYEWPGNARELRNVMGVAAARCADGVVDACALLPALRTLTGDVAVQPDLEHVCEVLADHDGNVSAAARALGVPRSTLRDWLRKAGRGGAGPGLRSVRPQPVSPGRASPQRMTKPA